MQFDVFFSISQTPVNGHTPNELTMFKNFFEQVHLADLLGFKTAWIAESHLSSEVQKRHKKPVIPHWQGEVGLNADIFQMAARIFGVTKQIEVGSAVMNLLTNGGPVAHAERAAVWATLEGLRYDNRRLHLGFATGRFDFMAAAFGIVPRTPVEQAFWPVCKTKVLKEASEIFLRLLRGDTLSSDDIAAPVLSRADFRTDDDWGKARALAGSAARSADGVDVIALDRRWVFDVLKIVPADWPRRLIQPVIGSHDAPLQEFVNTIAPVHVFNLSITKPEIIEDTHRRMARAFHPQGGPWQRSYMPRTVMVFLNDDLVISEEEKRAKAQAQAKSALGAYWTALEGTLDPKKVSDAADNAVIGNTDDVAKQLAERFHPDDRLMLWFDFFNHDSRAVCRSMEAFAHKVIPRIENFRV